MAMKPGERQVSPNLHGIRGDHKARYAFAGQLLNYGSRVLDAACGVGYGSRMLAQSSAECKVVGIDVEAEAIEYAKKHYPFDGVQYLRADARGFHSAKGFDAVVSFETIEHVPNPEDMVRNFARNAFRLIASVPNEKLLPFDPKRFNHHFRHFTPGEFEELLKVGGYEVTAWYCQKDAGLGKVTEGVDGRTIIVDAYRTLPGAGNE